MLVINRTSMKPPVGGHRYEEGDMVLRGGTVDEVVRLLIEHRIANSLPLGDPVQEVARFYQTIAPHMVTESGSPPRWANTDRHRVAESIMAVAYGKFDLLPRTHAEVVRRLAVCAGCPHKRLGFDEEPFRYWNEAETRAAIMTGDIDVMRDGHCSHHHWLNGLAARLVEPAKLAVLQNTPPDCYLHEA